MEAKKSELQNKISQLEKKIETIDEDAEIIKIRKNIQQLTSQKNSLGLFKGKQKKALQAQIDDLNKQYKAYWEKVSPIYNPLTDELEEVQQQLDNIVEQLTMDR